MHARGFVIGPMPHGPRSAWIADGKMPDLHGRAFFDFASMRHSESGVADPMKACRRSMDALQEHLRNASTG
jgi:hypothetical protein